ncbi:hypothetical protein SAMN05216571_106162 [Onishia taeanensis]|uniref:Phage major tail tube protein n=1 Tax=Onishia taeanensis TaxID=284577 RepID=A0A1G7SHG7_9GAMM|nr:phage major tail tube protein [Halomonas taeanensis]SDG22344.1 hypothetical protein SAMN05216571_106162 [Halomonas taeanensis]
MALPKTLKAFNLFGDGNDWMGEVESLTLPELSRKMEEYRGAGMLGPVEIDMGGQLLVFEWTVAGYIREIFTDFGGSIHDARLLRFTGSYESDETGEVQAIEVVMRGRHKTIGMDEMSAGEFSKISVTTTCTYYKLTINGEEVIEIDQPGMVYRVFGKDMYAERRKALGL